MMMQKIERTLSDPVTKDLCKKVRDDVRVLVVRTASLIKDPTQQAFIYANAARELMVAAGVGLHVASNHKISARKSMEIMETYIKTMNDHMVADLEKKGSVNDNQSSITLENVMDLVFGDLARKL